MITAGLEKVTALLEKSELAPNPERADWFQHTALLQELEDTFYKGVLKPFLAFEDALEEEDALDEDAPYSLTDPLLTFFIWKCRRFRRKSPTP